MIRAYPLAALALFALTRAEIIERIKAPAITKSSGLVQVVAECPPDIRRAHQMSVADFAADICERLYRGANIRPRQFPEPGIRIVLGDATNGVTNVTARVRRRADGSSLTSIYLHSPDSADVDRVRLETVKAFSRAVLTNEIDDVAAKILFREADPWLRAMDRYDELGRWLRGEPVEGDDEKFLQLSRSVLLPGEATETDVLRFSARLRLYPDSFAETFSNGAKELTFKEAIGLRDDEQVRLIAGRKSVEVVAWGMGHGEAMNKAVKLYQLFLLGLAAGDVEADKLEKLLALAEQQLKAVLKAPNQESQDEKTSD